MPVVKLSLTDKYYQKLKNMADAEFMSIQDYIRSKIFQERTIFEPEEAYRRATDGRFFCFDCARPRANDLFHHGF